jgi:hypothetical protein
MRIIVNIERLVLDGLPITPAEGRQIRRTVETEMRHLLAAGAPEFHPAAASAVPVLTAPMLHLDGGESPAVISARIARSLYGALRPTNQGDRR